ncbi:hypothetical protein GF312_10550 [Candidatus Poribacteria bacterium]|nr:hypothetical protein [Candidatus Poribacteria bacterium]
MPKESKSPLLEYAGSILKIAVGIVAPILLGFFVGNLIDKRLNSAPWMTLLLLMLGVIMSFGWLYRISKQSQDD